MIESNWLRGVAATIFGIGMAIYFGGPMTLGGLAGFTAWLAGMIIFWFAFESWYRFYRETTSYSGIHDEDDDD